jgi:acyl carrier protein
MSEPNRRTDEIVGDIWKEFLKVPDVSPEDNFLDLGGNSLRAGEIAARLRRELGVDVPIDVVLSEDSFATFSAAVDRLRRECSVNEPVVPQ